MLEQILDKARSRWAVFVTADTRPSSARASSTSQTWFTRGPRKGTPFMNHIRARRGGPLVLAAVLALALSACASGGRKDTGSTSSSSGGGAGDNSGYTIAMVTHETPGDTFWDKIKAGAQQAAANEGVTLKYSNDPDPGKQSTLIQNAVDSKVQGIATTLATPDALKGAVQNAKSAGIPVVAFNSGIDQYSEVGASMYFGSDENLAGQTAGQRIADAGGQ